MNCGRGGITAGGGGRASPGFFRFLLLDLGGGLPFPKDTGRGFSATSIGGRSLSLAIGEWTDESGETDVISMDGEWCLVVEGELGDGESSGAGGGGR